MNVMRDFQPTAARSMDDEAGPKVPHPRPHPLLRRHRRSIPTDASSAPAQRSDEASLQRNCDGGVAATIAAIQSATPPASTPPAAPAPDPLAGLRENAPPVDVPWPPWVWWAIGVGAVIVLALLVWLVVWLVRRKPAAPPPTPRMIALRALEELRAHIRELDPYAFSVCVSDVLRTYVGAQFTLPTTSQTSPEFLASIADSPRFSGVDRQLLATFLERCDMQKFARIEAHAEENGELLGSATAFVQGTRT